MGERKEERKLEKLRRKGEGKRQGESGGLNLLHILLNSLAFAYLCNYMLLLFSYKPAMNSGI